MRNLRERDAQMYLLDSEEQYNIPKEENEQTKKAIDYYLGKLRGSGVDENTGLHRNQR